MDPDCPNDLRRLGVWLRSQRLRAHLTQTQLALRLGISYQMVQKFENGASCLTVERLGQFIRVVRVSTWQLSKLGVVLGIQAGPLAPASLPEDEKRLLLALNRIHDKSIRRTLIEHVEALGRK